ncbi:MAG: GNAT family N-acetyltransferase [Anaerolineales bacterium]|nr:GNAT family N-acetyltransferase [Anaerolineales bacterium]
MIAMVRRNFSEKSRSCVRWLPQGRVVENGRFTLIDSGLPSDTYNVVVSHDLHDTATLLCDGVGHFMAQQRPMALWYWEEATDRANVGDLLAYGLHHAETDAAMMADLTILRPQAVAVAGLSIGRVQTLAEWRHFGRLLEQGFGVTEEGTAVAHYYAQRPSYTPADNPDLRHYLGWLDEEIVATGTLFVGSETVGLYDVMTREDVRRRGIGSAMFVHLLQETAVLPHRYAVLQASAAGAGLYRRAGFADVGVVHIFENRPLL